MARRKQRNGLFSLYNLLSIDTFSQTDLAKGLAHESIETLLVDLKLNFPYFFNYCFNNAKMPALKHFHLDIYQFRYSQQFFFVFYHTSFSEEMFYTFIPNLII